jgi:hypothetical protein
MDTDPSITVDMLAKQLKIDLAVCPGSEMFDEAEYTDFAERILAMVASVNAEDMDPVYVAQCVIESMLARRKRERLASP